MKYNGLVLLCLSILFFGCNVDQTKLDGCNLDEIRKSNTITDECRQSIQSLLPTPEDNLANVRTALGKTKVSTKPVLFVLGGNSASSIMVKAGVIPLVESDYLIKSLADYTGISISTSMIVDYSESMTDKDITSSIGIYESLFGILKNVSESEIRIFSFSVVQKQNFTSNYNTLISNISKDDSFIRSSTALYDAIGSGLSALATRATPIRLLIVTTDGRENSSIMYDKTSVISLATRNHIPVVIMGTLLSDVGAMKSLANGTNGIFIYARNLQDLSTKGKELESMLSKIRVIEITNPLYTNSSFTVTVDNVDLSFSAQ